MDKSNAELLGDYLPHALLADALGMSLKTLENLNRAGDSPPRVKLGRHTYHHTGIGSRVVAETRGRSTARVNQMISRRHASRHNASLHVAAQHDTAPHNETLI